MRRRETEKPLLYPAGTTANAMTPALQVLGDFTQVAQGAEQQDFIVELERILRGRRQHDLIQVLDQQTLKIVLPQMQRIHVLPRKPLRGAHLDSKLVVSETDVIHDLGVDHAAGKPQAHFMFGMHDMIATQFLKDFMVIGIKCLCPYLWFRHALDNQRGKNVGFNILPDGDHHAVAFVHAEIAQYFLIACVGYHCLGNSIGDVADEIGIEIDANNIIARGETVQGQWSIQRRQGRQRYRYVS